MANKSIKTVLSARISVPLKAALDIYSTASNKKVVELIEVSLNNLLEQCVVVSPIDKTKNVPVLNILNSIWTDNPLVYKLRLGLLGAEYGGDLLWKTALTATSEFPGEFSLMPEGNEPWVSALNVKVDLELIFQNWDTIMKYREFLNNNAPFHISFQEYKEKLNKPLI